MSEEEHILKRGTLRVTHEKAVIDGERYPITSLQNVRLETIKPSIITALLLALFTAIIGFVVVKMGMGLADVGDDNQGKFSLIVALILLGAVLFASGLATFNTFKNRVDIHQVVLKQRGKDETVVMKDEDRNRALEVVDAIQKAIDAAAKG